ncbi:MAG TPA: ScyD/ScyE family protein, partial [Pyrinomonadaceae bacterium]
LVVTLTALLLAGTPAHAQVICPVTEVTAGLLRPLGITHSNQGNLLVSETGTATPDTGRVSIVGLDGTRRTLLDGLPSAISDVGDPSGPSGLFLRGRTLYVAIGVGDTILPGPSPGTAVANPNPTSPIFSSVLAVHFSANVEKRTDGLTLTADDEQALADGEKVSLGSGRDKITVELIANFPNTSPAAIPGTVNGSNPFDLVAVGDTLYVTDGGMNLVWQVDLATGASTVLATFPPIPNPLFNPTPPPPSVGGPFMQAVPTGIAYSDGQLLVTLFRGVPFAPGTSVVEQIDPQTGEHAPLIGGLKTAIDVLPITEGGDTDHLVLQHASLGPFFGSPGVLLRFETPESSPTVLANCLNRPTSMALDEKTGTLYVTELLTGRVVAIPID